MKSGHSAVFHVIILTTEDGGTDTVVSQFFGRTILQDILRQQTLLL